MISSNQFIVLNNEFKEDQYMFGIEFYAAPYSYLTISNKITTIYQNVTKCNTTTILSFTRIGSGKSSSTAKVFRNVTNCTTFLNATNVTIPIYNTSYIYNGTISIQVSNIQIN